MRPAEKFRLSPLRLAALRADVKPLQVARDAAADLSSLRREVASLELEIFRQRMEMREEGDAWLTTRFVVSIITLAIVTVTALALFGAP